MPEASRTFTKRRRNISCWSRQAVCTRGVVMMSDRLVILVLMLSGGCSQSSSKPPADQPRNPPVVQSPMPATDFSTQSPRPPYNSGPTSFGNAPIANPIPTIPAPDQCYKATPTICEAERLITQLTNQIRQVRSGSPLLHDERLSFIARAWSQEQARVRDISHDGFPQLRVALFRQEFVGLRVPEFSAENVAMSYMGRSANPNSVAQEFVQMWRTSVGHLLNMLGNHRTLGVGIAQSADGALYATQIFGN